ncbi:carboxymuconolactone decarboxylase family protein [Apibacter sp. HY039]|uniref:carboxymuconolactone decarboxylase family protein n=1 Tax=Apibacter sp. HY039 TaxID=2501476 RepID=UPI000FEBC7FD|nr:carboxymuconolactone decarboxylase family protein [Apibacter sp. HY039]
MDTRLNMSKLEPEAYKIMYSFEKYLDNSEITMTHRELLKIRASQINGCAFCLDLHTREALKTGETQKRINLVGVWREVPFFTKEERIILQLTEEVTLINKKGVSDETYEEALQLLGEKYLAQILMAITIINSWNRIAISTKMLPESV